MAALTEAARHLLLLRMALGTVGLQPDDKRRIETPRRISECLGLVNAGVACGETGFAAGKMPVTALQAFMEAQIWSRYPESTAALSKLFAAYVLRGYILVDGPVVRVIRPGNTYPDHWLPLEQAVVTPCIPTLLALIDNGADTTKVEGGDLIAFARKNTRQSKVDQMVADITEAVMRRQLRTAEGHVSAAHPAPRRSPGV